MEKLSLKLALLLHFILINSITIFCQQGDDPDDIYKNYYPDFSITSPAFYYLPGDTVKMKVWLQWIKKTAGFKVIVYRINDPEAFFLRQGKKLLYQVVGTDSSNLFSLLQEIESFDKTVKYKPPPEPKKVKKEKKNFNETERSWLIEDEITYIPKDYGTYLVRVYFKNKVASCGFFASRIGLLTKTVESSMLNYTMNRISSEPVDDVKLSIFMSSIKLDSGYTSGGVLQTLFSETIEKTFRRTRNFVPFIIARKDNETAVSDPNMFFYYYAQPYKGYIVTNQPVYRPPETVNFKASMRKLAFTGYTVYAKQKLSVVIYDSKGAKMFKKFMVTDDNGSISDSIKIEQDAPLGDYKIQVDVIDSVDEKDEDSFVLQSFTQAFGVEEYKKPEYKVELKTDKEQYSGKEKINVQVQSDYYFGSPVQEGEVEYKIFKKALYRPWWYFSEYRWWYEQYYSGENQQFSGSTFISKGTGKLDKKGYLEIKYTLNENFKVKRNLYEGDTSYYETDYTYIIDVSVKDKSRHNVISTKSVNVTRAEYLLSSHTDKYLYKPGEKIGLIIRAADFSDKPVQANLVISVNRFVYEGKYPKMKRITSYVGNYTGKTALDGEEIIFIDAPLEGYYEMEITSFDSKGKKITDSKTCLASAGYMWWQYRDPGAIEIVPEKESYFPGDTCIALIMTPHENVNVLVTNYNKNILSYWVERIDGNSAYLKIPVTELSSPNFYINASYIYNGQVYENSKPIAVIPVHKLLNIGLSSDKPTYKPRDEGLINIAVRDEFGKPVKDAEVTLAVIDESIYAIKPENIPDIRTAFYAPGSYGSTEFYSYNSFYAYNIRSDFPSYFETYDFKQYKNEDLAVIRGKLLTMKGWAVPYYHVIIDKKFTAARTLKDGSFRFYVPGGSHIINFSNGTYFVEGDITLNTINGKIDSLEVRTDQGKIELVNINGEYSEIIKPDEKTVTSFGSILGKVTDSKDGSPLVGAVVKIEGTGLGTLTDEKGFYNFSAVPIGSYFLKCTFIGYDVYVMKINVEKGKMVNTDFAMTSGAVMTDRLVVEGMKKPLAFDQSGRIIDKEFIENTGIRGIENISAKTSGIIEDEHGNAINIRGGRTNETAIIIDGVLTTEKHEFVEAVTRTDFRDAILWLPSVKTDEEGNAQVKVQFPDNLTTWRVTARVLTKETDVGQCVQSVISRKDLIVRVETPRFFQQKDEVVVSTIVHNYLNEDKLTKISLALDNVQLINPVSNEQMITLLKNEEKRIDWVVKVDNPMGEAKVLASALTNEESDAMEQKVVIHPYGLKIANYNTFRLNSGSVTKTFEIPNQTDIRSSSLTIGISPSLASTIIGSLDALIGYPYGCIEQTMSRFMPTVIAANVFKETGAPPDSFLTGQINLMVKKGFNKIYSQQKPDGGWGWWTNDKSDPFMSTYVLYGLTMAKASGYDVRNDVYDGAFGFVKKYSAKKKIDASTKAFMVYTLALSDTSDAQFIRKQIKKLEDSKINDMAKAFLSMAAGMVGDKERQMNFISDLVQDVSYSGDNAYWKGKYLRYSWQEDDIQTTAMVLKALMANEKAARENRSLIEEGINWLVSQRKGNSWGNTQQTAFIVYTLADYIRYNREIEADYQLKVSINNQQVLDKQITAGDIFKPEIKIDVIGTVIRNGENEIRIEKIGTGKTYVSTALTYYQSENYKRVEETDEGFEIEREYYELKQVTDDKAGKIYYKKKTFDGTVKSGKELFVRIKVTPSADNLSYFMLEEPIPAGCEIIKEEWAYPIEEESDYNGEYSSGWRWWFADKEIRDNRIVYFASHVGKQTYEFSYLLRAEIPGTYNIMPSRGVLMYYPEVNGSSSDMKLKIIDSP